MRPRCTSAGTRTSAGTLRSACAPHRASSRAFCLVFLPEDGPRRSGLGRARGPGDDGCPLAQRADQLGARRDAELGEDAVQVTPDRPVGEVQAAADLLVAEPLHHEARDLALL